MKSQDIVITAAGLLSKAGDDLGQHLASLTDGALRQTPEDYQLQDFKPAPYLTDRRILKSVSKGDALGLVAIELLKKNAGENTVAAAYGEDRVGLYVGAPPASAWNAADYFDAIRSSRDDSGACDPQKFGKECMNARPTTLLIGLPNNVLCYGSIVLGAKGPNSNYTSGETSGQLAVINAARRIAMGKLDAAVAGGFSAHGEPVVQSMLEQNGMLRASGGGGAFTIAPGGGGTIAAEGAFFYLLERRDGAERRGAEILLAYAGGASASSALGRFGATLCEDAVELATRRCLERAGVGADEIGVVLSSATGIEAIDASERRGLWRLFARVTKKPALGTTAPLWGNLIEAGGLGELAIVPELYRRGSLPEAMRLVPSHQTGAIDAEKPYALIVRTSTFGETSCLLVRNVA